MSNLTAALLFSQFDAFDEKVNHHIEMYDTVDNVLDKTYVKMPYV